MVEFNQSTQTSNVAGDEPIDEFIKENLSGTHLGKTESRFESCIAFTL